MIDTIAIILVNLPFIVSISDLFLFRQLFLASIGQFQCVCWPSIMSDYFCVCQFRV